jgi:CRP/FNR family cyclic AMP-dependent transcriptional regulator
MGMSIAPAPQIRPLEDPLAHLPCSTILEYRKGQTIYSRDQPSTSIYLVIDGKVKVCRMADDGRQVVVDLYQPDEFFGESAFLGPAQRTELSVALENTKLMTWTTTEIEEIASRRPRLAIALLQLLVQRSMDFGSRIESFSVDNIARRLARALIRFSERLGHAAERLGADDSVHARAFVAIRGDFPRNRDALYEPVPAPGVFNLLAQGHPAAQGRFERLVAASAQRSVICV